jgi:hypothetical protein
VVRAVNSTAGNWANAKYHAYAHIWGVGGSASSSTAMTLDASQNLSVTSGNTNAMIGFNALNDSFTPGGGATTPQYGIARGSAGSNTLGVSGYSGLAFYTSGVERGRFDSGGTFIMRGNTNYVAPSTGSANFRIEAANGAGLNAFLYLTCPGSNEGAFYYERATSRLYAYSQSGGVYLNPTGTSWVATSDERFKDIIEPIMNAAQRLKSWRTVFGKFKSDEEGTRRAFFIAQDLLVNTPEVVDAVEPEKLGVLYTETIPVVAAAVNEHTDELASLKAAIQELNTRLTALEAN